MLAMGLLLGGAGAKCSDAEGESGGRPLLPIGALVAGVDPGGPIAPNPVDGDVGTPLRHQRERRVQRRGVSLRRQEAGRRPEVAVGDRHVALCVVSWLRRDRSGRVMGRLTHIQARQAMSR